MPKKPVLPEFDPETNEPLYNWTKHSNRLIDLFAEGKLTGDLQLAALMHIASRTWGFDPKRTWTRLPVNQEAKRLGCTRQALTNALNDAEERKLLESKQLGKGNRRAKLYRLTQLQDVLDRPPKKGPEPGETEAAVPARNTMVLLPGHSGTLTVNLMVNSQLTKINVKWHNTLDQRATFQADPGNDGELIVSILERPKSAENPEAEKGEQKVELVAEPTLHESVKKQPHSIESKEVIENNQKQPFGTLQKAENDPDSGPRPAPIPIDRKPAENPNPARREFEAFVTQLRQEVWKISTDPDFLRRIMERAEDAPVAVFENRLVTRFGRDYRRPLGRLSRQDTGLLLELASDALNDHRAAKALPKADRSVPTPLTADQIDQFNRLVEEDRQKEIAEKHERTEADKLKCPGCGGSGKRESGIKGIFKTCGLCHGSAQKAKAATA